MWTAMIDRLIFYIKKYEGVLLYLIFGVLTTAVNFVAYYICYTKFHWINLASNTVAWILSVMFAFITNKIWVFKSKSFQNELVLRELITFVVSRLSTWLLETVIMFVGVDILKGYWLIAKVIASVLVVILNYVFSKLFIFRKNNENA
ncbi:GtrA family protein [Lachnoanaerobaculum sp.]